MKPAKANAENAVALTNYFERNYTVSSLLARLAVPYPKSGADGQDKQIIL